MNVRPLSANATVDIESAALGQRTDMDVDSDSSSYTDDEGSDSSPSGSTSPNGTGVWSKEEHAKFLEATKSYANGPWKIVAAYVGTRTVRQTMTHAQKYRQKAARRLRGLRTKQALMRMHCGHHVSEESLMQERLRAMGTATNNNSSNYHNLTCEPIGYSFDEVSVGDPITTGSCVEMLSSDTTPWAFPQSTEEPACMNATMLDVEEVDLLEDLTSSPTLEECATELLNLLF